VAYLLLYALLRGMWPAALANGVSLLVTAVGNTAANRRYTFAVRGAGGWWRHQAKGLAAFGFALAVTSGSLALLQAVAPAASRAVEMTVLVVANLVATVLRFLLLRHWVFRRRSVRPVPRPVPTTVPTTARSAS
jgi:putative flippase GtrA